MTEKTNEWLIKSLGEPDNSIEDHSYEIRPLIVEGKREWWIFHNGVGSGEPLAQWLEAYAAQQFKIATEEETIICAAIWYKDLQMVKPEVLDGRGFRPYNVDRGIVFAGWRHPNCLYQMVAMTGKYQHEVGKEIQGFLTSKNRFLNRHEAAQLHVKNGGKLEFNTELFSEDLY